MKITGEVSLFCLIGVNVLLFVFLFIPAGFTLFPSIIISLSALYPQVTTFVIPLTLGLVDLGTLLFLLYRRLEPLKLRLLVLSFALFYLGHSLIYFLNNEETFYHKIPLSRNEALSLISECKVVMIILWNDGRIVEESLKDPNGNQYERPVNQISFEELKNASYDAYNRCGLIQVNDTTPQGQADLTSGYQVRGSHVFYDGDLIGEADPKSFVKVGLLYAKDAAHVYYFGKVVPDADPAQCSASDLAGCAGPK